MATDTPTLQWSTEEPAIPVPTPHELDQALHKIAARCTAERPIIVALYAHGYEVGIGLGLPQSFVNVKSWERDTPESCLITVGDERTVHGIVFFFLNARPTEIPQRNLIPATQARQIVREFLETGNRSKSVKWEQL